MLIENVTIVCLLLLLGSSEALRILVGFPMASKSHSILGHGIVNRLLEGGHEVVHMTAFPHGKKVSKLKEITIPNFMEEIIKQDPEKFEIFKLKNMVGKSNFGDSMLFLYFVHNFHQQFLESEDIVKFLSDPKEKFDAVILEWFFSDFIAGIAPIFQCPLIWLGSTEAHWQVIKLVDETTNPSYTVDLFSTSKPPLTFWERLMELWMMVKKAAVINTIIVPLEKSVYNSVFPDVAAKRGLPSVPSYEESVYNASFLLLNSHPSYGSAFRLPQSAKYIGGYHIDDKAQPLPKDLQKLMDEAKHGVIYFSMGSNLKSEDMSKEMQESLMKMFSKLKQTVLWKFESDLENVPSNIHLLKWAPQQSIFAHPNLKFFITHGGQLSTTEAIHYGVPVIGIPVLGDQFVNMESVAKNGFGIKVTLAEDMAKDLLKAIEKMLSNPAYKERAKEISSMYHDRIMPPGKELVFWVEHVVKTRGAPHLRSPALMLPWYQKMYLDLAALILVVIISLYIMLKKYILKMSSKHRTKKQKKQ